MLIDVHSHLDFPQFDNDREYVIERASKEDIIIINSGLGPEGIERTLSLSERYENVLATLGLSPQEFDGNVICEVINLIRRYRDEIVGIGEVGLDYYWVRDGEKRKLEMENFEKFMDLSIELNLPLVIHSRDAENDVIEKLIEYDMGALLHCFSGNLRQAEKAISIGCLISIPTSVVYSKQKQKLVREIPLENIVLESDAPYLSPVPRTRNEPINIKMSLKKISEIKNIDIEEIAEVTTKNAMSFFNLQF
ncbi:MAG: DNase [Candidatus Altiarchaeales archaeon]|nr:MAG: DNase [Candidatus Altiarchaeales archaeon]